MFLPKDLLALKALTPLPPAVERFLARRPQGRRLPGVRCYVRGRVLDRYREESLRGNAGQLPFARTDRGAELRVDLATGAVLQVEAGGHSSVVAPGFDGWLRGLMEEAKALARRPLVRAARAGDLKRIASLLTRGADINQQDGEGHTPLMAALLAWQYDAARLLLRHAPHLALRDREGHTALMWAAYRNQPGIVEQLIAAGADVNARTGGGEPVLLFALTGPYALAEQRPHGSAEVLALLLAAGAAPLAPGQLPAALRADTDPVLLRLLEEWTGNGGK